MIYYSNNNSLFATETPVCDSSFVIISEAEYNRRVNTAVNSREIPTAVINSGDVELWN